tara:strand:+ start:321 stop:521 length:201 start_codon:yes stop_codon:yes gene_type:complete
MKITKEKLKQLIKEELQGRSDTEVALEELVKDIDNLIRGMSDKDRLPFLQYLIKNIELRIERDHTG